MRTDAEKDGPKWAERSDDRCTRFGALLRKTRLDELPQLWNILKGEMSFVGPRPERKYFYEQFEKYIVGFSNRLVVIPGLTGYAQVNGGYELAPEEKIVYDMGIHCPPVDPARSAMYRKNGASHFYPRWCTLRKHDEDRRNIHERYTVPAAGSGKVEVTLLDIRSAALQELLAALARVLAGAAFFWSRPS